LVPVYRHGYQKEDCKGVPTLTLRSFLPGYQDPEPVSKNWQAPGYDISRTKRVKDTRK